MTLVSPAAANGEQLSANAGVKLAGPADESWPILPDLPGALNPTPLPTEVLPPSLRGQVQSVTDSMQVPADLPCMLSLAACSTALAGRVEIAVRPGWREPCNLYVACILPPASRKSPAYAAMTAPIRDWEEEAIRQAAPNLAAARDKVLAGEFAVQRAIKAATTTGSDRNQLSDARRELSAAEAAVPPDGRLLAGDITSEAIVQRIAAQGGRLAILEPEPGPLQLLAGRYSDSARLDELKKCWSGEDILVDRVGRPPVRVLKPALTLALMVQPGVIESLPHGKAFRYEGVLARFLWCVPPHGLGRRLTGSGVPSLHDGAAMEYTQVLRELLNLEPPTSRNGEATRHVISLAPEAVEILHTVEAEVEADLADGGEYEEIRDWAGKMVGHSVRIAALLALARRAGTGADLLAPIDSDSMAGGAAILRALSSHALHVMTERNDGRTGDLRVGSTIKVQFGEQIDHPIEVVG